METRVKEAVHNYRSFDEVTTEEIFIYLDDRKKIVLPYSREIVMEEFGVELPEALNYFNAWKHSIKKGD